VFSEKNNPGQVLFALLPNATTCSCSFWNAYQMQCSHLLLLHKGPCLNLCSSGWHQSSGLRSSVGKDEDVLESTDISTVGVDNLSTANDASVLERRDVDDDASNGARHVAFADIVNFASKLSQSVANLCNETQKIISSLK
jgi:hypothetical protein